MNAFTLAFACAASVLTFNGCTDWQRNVTVGGTEFSEVKINSRGFVIGLLANDATIGDRRCRRGWVHVHPNGVAAAFTAAEAFAFGKLTVPADTWVRQDERGHVTFCAFPQATLVQGQWCRGTGGPKGVTTAFYPSGALKNFYPVRNVVIDGVPCRTGIFNGWVELHEDGRLKACLLDEDIERGGRRYRRGTRVEFDPAGKIVPVTDFPSWPAVGG